MIDWLGLEKDIREALRMAEATVTDPGATAGDLALILAHISDEVGLATGRGYELSEDFLKRWEGFTSGR